MTSRRFDDAARAIARLQRRLDDLWKLASRKGHGHVLGYAEVTANQTGITSDVDLTGLSVTVDLPANRRIRISAVVAFRSDTADDRVALRIKDGTTQLQRAAVVLGLTNEDETVSPATVETPSSGSHTYKLTAQRVDGTGTAQMTAASAAPAFILVEDLGAA